jgi:hypothetical protein
VLVSLRGPCTIVPMSRRTSIARPWPCALAGVAMLLAAAAPAQPVVAPHAASYELSLHASARGGDVVAVKGRLDVRLALSCDGWQLENSLGFRMLTEDGAALEHLAHLSAFEERDGGEFVFSTRTWEDRELVERLSGVARRGDGGVQVRYSLPEAAHEALPADTIFPGQHLEQILAAARAGKRSLMRTVFDGSTANNPYQISGWFGSPRAADAQAPPALAGRTAWPLRLAYYPATTVEPQAQFEMSVLLYDNGVAADMVYDYGAFAIDVRLRSLELLEVPVCP